MTTQYIAGPVTLEGMSGSSYAKIGLVLFVSLAVVALVALAVILSIKNIRDVPASMPESKATRRSLLLVPVVGVLTGYVGQSLGWCLTGMWCYIVLLGTWAYMRRKTYERNLGAQSVIKRR